MKKTIFIAVAFVLTLLLLTACTNIPTPTEPSVSKGGVVEDDTFFNDDNGTGSTQQPGSSAVPGTSTPGTSVPGTSAPSASVPSTSVPSTSVPSTSVPSTTAPGTSAPATQPSTQPTGPNTSLTYEEFHAMTGAEQRAHQESFANLDDFFDWYNAAKETYEKENPPIEIGGNGEVNLGGGNG